MIGKEYFNGNIFNMIENTEKLLITFEYIINKVNLYNDLLNNKLNRFIIYNDLKINKSVYDFIKENDVDVYDLHNNKDAYSLYDYTRDEINIKIDILNRKKTIEEIIETFLNRIIEIAEKIPNTDGIKSFLENAPEMINKISPENRDMITKIIGYDFPKKNTRKKSVK